MYELTMDFSENPVCTDSDINSVLKHVAEKIVGKILTISQRRALFSSLGLRIKGHRYQINGVSDAESIAA